MNLGASRMKIVLSGLGLMVAGCTTVPPVAPLSPIAREAPAQSPIASSVRVPTGHSLVYVSGTVPDAVDPSAAEGSVKRYGDTEAQTRSVLAKIEQELHKHGLALDDVVMMRVFLVAPPGQAAMDFAGMMRAYRERFASPGNPAKPARSTMQVAGLVNPGWLVEIVVTAASDMGSKAIIIH